MSATDPLAVTATTSCAPPEAAARVADLADAGLLEVAELAAARATAPAVAPPRTGMCA